ncbi:MAG: T9SS type A sorting domain-containing protein, partial [Candidatus Pacearchaeota archaeon]|nr:T9SS type A sorting domain-containing protein [Candidatus Pacearchaeota archaeon]
MTLDTFPPGLIPVGLPLLFKTEASGDSLRIGIRIDSLPHGFTLNDVRMYNREDGVFLVDRQSVIDSVNNIIYVRTGKENRSFVAMLDTLPPVITITGDTASPVSSTEQIMTSVNISDNIANVRWKYLYGSGDEIPVLHEQGDVLTSGENLSLIISDTSEAICPETGLRALLIIDDGRHMDTANVSRSVYQVESGEMNTGVNTWKPVYSTALLNDKTSTKLIRQLKHQQDIEGYNRKFMRLYRWISCKENENKTDKWIEYDEHSKDIQSLFTLEPGRILWVKTREDITLHLDSGRTLSLKDTFSIDLPPGQWTDFSMPFRFGVRLEEILSATGKGAESIHFYRWDHDSATGIYTLEPFYVRGMSDKTDRSIIFDYSKEGGYSLYNSGSETVTLRIPPTLPVAEGTLKKKVYNHHTSWSTKFIARAVGYPPLPAVYFGYAPETDDRSYPLAPCFTTLRLSVLDRTTSRQYGHSISRNGKDGLVRELMISNQTDSTCLIQYHMKPAGAFPESFNAYCYNPETGNSDTSGTVSISSQSSISRLIVIGNAGFQKDFTSRLGASKFSLHPLYPNPSRSIVNIRYTVPLGAQEHIAVAIHDILGRKIWKTETDRLLEEGVHTIIWNGRDEHGGQAGSGIYIVRLTTEDRMHKKIRHFEKR